MFVLFLQLGTMLFVILAGAEIFTNALETLGERLKVSDGVTGSILAAVGTVLPETMVPVLALLGGTSSAKLSEEIGVGAILGAPLMLSTLSTFFMGLAVFRSRGFFGKVSPESTGFVRDLNFFITALGLAAFAMLLPVDTRGPRVIVGLTLLLLYVWYLVLTLRASSSLVEAGHGTATDRKMHLTRLKLPLILPTIVLQLVLGLLLLFLGAKGFIVGIEAVSATLQMSALLLSVIIIPIATELPEKVNSILWIRRGKDTLAFGNITGAMVFQGSVLAALGILATPWQPTHELVVVVGIALIAGLWLRIMGRRGPLPLWALWFNGGLYLGFLALAFFP